jgi:hypothetical protein
MRSRLSRFNAIHLSRVNNRPWAVIAVASSPKQTIWSKKGYVRLVSTIQALHHSRGPAMFTRAPPYPSSFSLSMPSATKLNCWSVTYITRKPGR